MLKALPVVQEIWEDMVADLVDVFSVLMSYHIQMRGKDDHLASRGNCRLHLIHGFGSRPQLVIHGRRARQLPLERALAPTNIFLRRKVCRLAPGVNYIADEHATQV